MKKNNDTYNDEIDLFELFRIIWNRKIIVIFTLLASIAIFSYNQSQKPVFYNISSNIKPSKNSEFDQFLLITSFINNSRDIIVSKSENLLTSVNNIKIYNKFIDQISDSDVIIGVFKNNKYIKKRISQLTEIDKEKTLFSYSQLIRIDRTDENDQASISFKWNSSKEGEEILMELISLVMEKLEKDVFKNLNNRIDLIQNITERKNLSRIEYLLEQNEIAKELNISNNQINSVNLYNSRDTLSINNSHDNIPYYLRGYKAIEKEISLIENRDPSAIKNVKKLISSLESNNQIKWIKFNSYSINVTSLQKSKRNLILSIILGLFLGVGYILISNAYNSSKKLKKII